MELVNAHITENIDYYKRYCNSLYRGRYLADDLFQEFYLLATQTPPKTIEKYHSQGNLKTLCNLIIYRIFSHRSRKKTVSADSSPLFETCNLCESTYTLEAVSTDEYDYTLDRQTEERLERLDQKVKDNLKGKDWYPTKVLLQAQEESISEISRKSGIDRQSLSRACKQAAFEIRRYVE